VVWLRVLSRRNLSHPARRSTPNSRWLTLLQTLCRHQKSQLLWNQANPRSLRKTPGVGVPPQSSPLESATSRLFIRASVCNLVNAPANRPHYSLPPSTFSSLLCFHTLTNPFSRNSFIFTSIQIPRGCGVFRPEAESRRSRLPGNFGLLPGAAC
jgi:hypothetical protein